MSLAAGIGPVIPRDQDQRGDEDGDHGDQQHEFGRAYRLLAAEYEEDLPDHGDQADGEQRLGDQVVGGDSAVTIASPEAGVTTGPFGIRGREAGLTGNL
jgi:hypothetical protein